MENNSDKHQTTCQFEMSNGLLCGRTLYDDENCIFHSKDIDKKKSNFDEVFWKEFDRQNKKEIVFDFTGFIFPNSISFEKIEFDKSTYFIEAEFLGERTVFRRSKFSGEITDFGEAKFLANNIFFDGAYFSGKKVDFSMAEFQCQKISFYGTQFAGGETDFRGVHFSGEEIDFHKARFSGEKADFQSAKFSREDTRSAISRFFVKSKKNSVKNIKIDISFSYFNNVFNLFEALEHKKKIILFKKKVYLFNDFRFLLGEATAIQYPLINRKSKDAWYLNDFRKQHPIIYTIWNITSACGQKIIRWALWSLLFALLFAFIYHNCFYLVDKTAFETIYINETWSGISFIYYSVVTFTTLGFGDIVPKKGWIQFWVMLEVILGYIMLGGLISIFSNKLSRRS